MRECVDIIYYAKRFSLCELSNMGKEIDYKWKKFDELSLDELNKIEKKLTKEVLKVFNLKNSVNSKKSYGGTSFDNIKKMIMKYKKKND